MFNFDSLPAIVVFGILVLVLLVVVVATVFNQAKLSNHPFAFALPAGSVRALLALGLLVSAVALTHAVTSQPADFPESASGEQNFADQAALDRFRETYGNRAVIIPIATSNGSITAQVHPISRPAASDELLQQALTVFLAALTTVIGFYFGSRSANARNDVTRAQALIIEQNRLTRQLPGLEAEMKEAERALAEALRAAGSSGHIRGKTAEELRNRIEDINDADLKAQAEESRLAYINASEDFNAANNRLAEIVEILTDTPSSSATPPPAA